MYFVDKKFIYTEKSVDLYIKKIKWKEENYVLVKKILYTDCFDNLVNRYNDLLKEVINKIVDISCEEN